MKKIWTKIILIFLYCGAIIFASGKNAINLLNFKEFLLVLFGTGLLTITEKPDKSTILKDISLNGFFAGLFCSMILIFAEPETTKENAQEILFTTDFLILKCRTLFYGILIYFVFHQEEKNEKKELTESIEKSNTKELTRREKQIAKMAQKGMTNKEIAEELCISAVTVKTHLNNIYEKLNINSRKEINLDI